MFTCIFFSINLEAQIIGLHNTAPKPRQYVAGGIALSIADATFDDGGHKLFGTSTKYKIIKAYTYTSGPGVITSYTESAPIPLYFPGFDIWAYHNNWSTDRADITVRFYDVNSNYLGKFFYQKTANSWSTTISYTNIHFYDSVGTLILDISAVDFAGTTYGNTQLRQSISFADPTKISFKPDAYTVRNNLCSVDNTYTVSHPFKTVSYMTLEIHKLVSNYSASGNAQVRAGGYYSLWGPR